MLGTHEKSLRSSIHALETRVTIILHYMTDILTCEQKVDPPPPWRALHGGWSGRNGGKGQGYLKTTISFIKSF